MLTKSLTRPTVYTLPAALVTVGLAILLPYLIHLFPDSGTPPIPMGARLLPIFYAPLLAILLDYPLAALIASLAAPYLNRVVIGSPATEEMTILLTLELTVFSLVVLLMTPAVSKSKSFGLLAYGVAPFGYAAAKAVEYLFLLAQPDFILPTASDYVKNSAEHALPGILILWVLNIAAVIVLNRQKTSKVAR